MAAAPLEFVEGVGKEGNLPLARAPEALVAAIRELALARRVTGMVEHPQGWVFHQQKGKFN